MPRNFKVNNESFPETLISALSPPDALAGQATTTGAANGAQSSPGTRLAPAFLEKPAPSSTTRTAKLHRGDGRAPRTMGRCCWGAAQKLGQGQWLPGGRGDPPPEHPLLPKVSLPGPWSVREDGVCRGGGSCGFRVGVDRGSTGHPHFQGPRGSE